MNFFCTHEPTQTKESKMAEPESELKKDGQTVVEFEGMDIKIKEIEEIESLRKRGQDIKDGIDLKHVYNGNGLVLEFQVALNRAKREVELDKALAEPLPHVNVRPAFFSKR